MKVVCVKYPPTFIELKLRVGDVTEAHIKNLGQPTRNFLFTIDSGGNHIPCDALDTKKYFITLEEFRERRLEVLGI